MGYHKRSNGQKWKKPKVSSKTSKYRLYVKFLPQYQKTRDGSFNYLSDDYKDSETGLRQMLRRLFNPENKNGIVGKYYRAMLYNQETKQCMAVWIPGRGKMTYDDYKDLYQKKNSGSITEKSPIRAWIRLKNGSLKMNRLKADLSSNITWSNTQYEDPRLGVAGKDVAIYHIRQRLMSDDMKYQFAECRLYCATSSQHVATINHLGHLQCHDKLLAHELKITGNYPPYLLGLFDDYAPESTTSR